MVATLKTGVVQEPSSSTANLTLDASGGVTVGQNLTVTGSTTITGNQSAPAFIPTGATVPTNGLYKPAANAVGLATNSTNALYIDASQNVGIGTTSPTQKLTISGNANTTGTMVMSSAFTMRNKIINGAMMIDQRNAGANSSAYSDYTLDRWFITAGGVSGKLTTQQNKGSVTPPAGFSTYLGVSSSSAYSVSASDRFAVTQPIEGYNTVDFAFGTSSAKTVTISFWAYSSLTGTFGGSLQNYAGTRSYPFAYTISSSNTWTYTTITVPGDTSGTWVGASNAGSFLLNFGLGVGSTYSGTAGAWASSNYISATGAVSVVGTNAATFYITGVQLEIGTAATPFEYRNYQQELAMCQRYYWRITGGSTASFPGIGSGVATGGTSGRMYFKHPVTMRTSPTYSFGGNINAYNGAGNPTISIATPYPGLDSGMFDITFSGSMTAGTAIVVNVQNTSSDYFQASAEL